MRIAIAAAMLCSACVSNTFTGDGGAVDFVSPLSREFEPFTPEHPIALGSHVHVSAVSPANPLLSETDPASTPAVTGSALAQESFRTDDWSGWAVAPGTTAFAWTGSFLDSFSVKVAPARTLELSDPLIYYLPDHLVEYGGPAYPDVGSHLELAAGGSLALEIVPRGDDGTALSFEPGWVQLDGGGAHQLALGEHELTVSAPATGPSTTTFSLLAPDGGVSATFVVDTPADASEDVGRIEIAQGKLGSNVFILRAAVFHRDGGVIWEPDIEWSLPAGVRDLQAPKDVASQVPRRRDMRVLAIGSLEATVQASFAGKQANAALIWGDGGTTMPGPAMTTPPATPPPACGCSGSPATFSLLALAVLVWSRRHIRLPRSA